ncbi:MAG: RlmE family RNA methyltransferase [Rickettsiales bacterium]
MANSNKNSGSRGLTTRVKTARGRKPSSTRWLQRQLNDPYVTKAKKEGYRSRAAYKLIELDDKFHFLKPTKTVLDLGAAPGGWTQVAADRVKSTTKKPLVIGVDILAMDEVAAATTIKLDFMADNAPKTITELIPAGVDIVLSDMAPNTIGHKATDHIRIIAMVESAYYFAREILKKDGVFIAKVFQGGADKELLTQMRKDFTSVKHAKPKASRSDSSEMYVVAMGFSGLSGKLR